MWHGADPVQGADLGAYLSQGADSAAAPAAAAPSAAADAVGGATDGAAEAGRGAADTLSSSLGSAQEAAGSVTEGGTCLRLGMQHPLLLSPSHHAQVLGGTCVSAMCLHAWLL